MLRPQRVSLSRGAIAGLAVTLSYRQFHPKAHDPQSAPLIVLHGLLGSKRNWTTLSNKFATALGMEVYALDMRNHGHSPHNAVHTFEAMAEDLLFFLDTHHIPKASLCAHSMGSKVAMVFALKHPDRTAALVAVDGSPLHLEPEGEAARIERYIDGLDEVIRRGAGTKEEVDAILKDFEADPSVRHFLQTNLAHHPHPPYFTVRPNLPVLREYLHGPVFDFPITSGERTFAGPTLFVVGARSNFVPPDAYGAIREGFFPNLEVCEIDAGHWVQVDRPAEFFDGVSKWLLGLRAGGLEADE
ncbi:Alpha/Beta hydrolase protein [Hyaloraphidium curvatum]|nr:Alpha/Beta hydrolase protein [Hyaloraphidium curvatum]